MYSYFKGLTHLRYLVYKDEQNQKKVLFQVENIIHATYAIENGIKPQQLTSLGYIGFHKGKWVLYEHYQLDERNISNEWREKKLIRTKLSDFSEIHDRKLQQLLEITYQKEKNLLLSVTKKTAMDTLSKIKKFFVKTRD